MKTTEIFKLVKSVKTYYNGIVKANVISGVKKWIFTDGTDCFEVETKSKVTGIKGYLFECERRNGETSIKLID